MNYRFLLTAFALGLALSSLTPTHADETSTTEHKMIDSNELQKIDTEIEHLKSSLNKLRKQALNQEMNSQPFLFDNWDQFAEGIEANEENEKQILQIKKEIDALIQLRQSLINQNPPQ